MPVELLITESTAAKRASPTKFARSASTLPTRVAVFFCHGFVTDDSRSLEYVSEFLCHGKNVVGYMAKVDSTRGGRKDTPPGWLGSVACDFQISTTLTGLPFALA